MNIKYKISPLVERYKNEQWEERERERETQVEAKDEAQSRYIQALLCTI